MDDRMPLGGQADVIPAVPIRPKTVAFGLFAVVIGLIALSVAGQILRLKFGHDTLKGLIPFVYVDYEANLPTWYSSFALFITALAAGLIAAAKQLAGDRYSLYWAVMSLGFLYLSLDEMGQVHEMIGRMIPQHWYAVALPAVAIFGLVYLKFLFSLPARTRTLLIVAGAIFLTGAVGFEMIENHHREVAGKEDAGWVVIVTIEECLEMTGVVIALYGLLDYLERHIQIVRLQFGGPT